MLGIWNSHRALAQGKYRGVRTPKPEYLVAPGRPRSGTSTLGSRLVFSLAAGRSGRC
jgi:hypothetical protein